MAIFGVRVDPLNEKAKEFYLKYSFVPLNLSLHNSDQPILLLPMKTIMETNSELTHSKQ